MPVLPFRNNPISYYRKGEERTYYPEGLFAYYSLIGTRRNPTFDTWDSWAARFFVGLSVNDVKKYSMNDIVRETRAFLRSYIAPTVIKMPNGKVKRFPAGKKLKENSTFIAQRGVYAHKKPPHKIVEEKSVQIVIFNETGLAEEQFTQFVKDFGDHLRVRFRQEAVIAELQHKGISQFTMEITA